MKITCMAKVLIDHGKTYLCACLKPVKHSTFYKLLYIVEKNMICMAKF